MHALGAEVRSVTSGTATLKDAVNEAMRDWVTNVETTHYVLGSAMGPHPYPTIVRDLQRRIGDEAAAQLDDVEGRLPDLAIACVGGGSNAIGLLARFIGEPTVRLAVAEAAGDGMETGRHAAAILGGTPGILHGSRSLMLQDRDGQVVEAHSASAGLDYPGIGPQLAALAEAGRIEVAAATDREAVAAMKATTRTEGILPALETAHAIAALPKVLAGVDGLAGGLTRPRDPGPPRLLGPRRQGPRRPDPFRGCPAMGERALTGDEVRALCLSLPETTEKETWGDEDNPGHPTFRVRDKIYVLMAADEIGRQHPDVDGRAVRPDERVPRRGADRRHTSGASAGSTSTSAGSPTRCCARSSSPPGRGPRPRSSPPPGADRDDDLLATLPGAVAGTNDTPGAQRIAAAFARAHDEGRAALIPYVVAGYPDTETSLAIALAAADAGADLLEIGLPYSDPLADGATLQRASQVAIRSGATLDGSLRLIERIGAARPDLPLVPMGYANQVLGGGDGDAVARRLAGAGAAGLIVADLTPDEGAPFEAVARAVGLAVVYLVAPTTPPPRRARDRRAERRLPLLRVAGRGDGRPDGAATDRRPAHQGREGGLAGPGRRRLRGQQARPRARHRQGRRGWRDRGVRPGRRPWRGRPRCAWPRAPRHGASGRHRSRMTIALLGVPSNSPVRGRCRAGAAGDSRGWPGRTPAERQPLVDLGDVQVDRPSPTRGPDGIIDAGNLARTLARSVRGSPTPDATVTGCS